MYRGAEAALGAALDGRRDDAIVATKIWAPSRRRGPRRSSTASSAWYGGRVDVEQVHNLVAWQTHVDWLERRARRRHASAGSASRTTSRPRSTSSRRRSRRGRFQVLQVPYNPWERECEQRAPAARRGARRRGDRDAAARRLGRGRAQAHRAVLRPSWSELGVALVGRGAAALGARRRPHRLRHPGDVTARARRRERSRRRRRALLRSEQRALVERLAR